VGTAGQGDGILKKAGVVAHSPMLPHTSVPGLFAPVRAGLTTPLL
jgi:hypothetical protein